MRDSFDSKANRMQKQLNASQIRWLGMKYENGELFHLYVITTKGKGLSVAQIQLRKLPMHQHQTCPVLLGFPFIGIHKNSLRA